MTVTFNSIAATMLTNKEEKELLLLFHADELEENL
jgi:hypothetical protein